jgi:hypothetical protein
MKKSKIIIVNTIIIVPIMIVVLFSCRHDFIYPDDYGYKGPCNCPEDTIPIYQKPCSPDTVYFQNQVLPLIQSSCGISGCHDAFPQDDAKNLTTYQKIISSGYIKPYNASNSKMIESITNSNPDDKMPPYPYPSLTSEQISLITKWMNQGALNNYCSSCDTSNVHFSSIIWPLIRDNCKGCHSGTAAPKNVNLENYQQVDAIVKDGRLMGVITGTGYSFMPPAGKLSPCKQNQIIKWINNGAHND